MHRFRAAVCTYCRWLFVALLVVSPRVAQFSPASAQDSPGSRQPRHGRGLGRQQLWPDQRPRRPGQRDRHRRRPLTTASRSRVTAPSPPGATTPPGRPPSPRGLANVIAVAAGANHSLALKSDGTVVAWGWNAYGQATVPTGLADVIAIAAGGDHSLALKSDGTVVAWGDNSSGQSTVPADLAGVSRHRRRPVPQPGAQERRHRRGLGLERLWPVHRARRPGERHRHRRRRLSQPGAQERRHGSSPGATTAAANPPCRPAWQA